MKELIGKTITGIYINDDNTLMLFTCADGVDVAYCTEADCCSESWFSSLTGIYHVIGNKVLDVEERPEIDNLDGTRQEVDALYGYYLKLSNKDYVNPSCKYAEIEFRNSSNGYYGGSCECLDRPLTNAERCELRHVTGDF